LPLSLSSERLGDEVWDDGGLIGLPGWFRVLVQKRARPCLLWETLTVPDQAMERQEGGRKGS
jgi:hypothetical protein